MRKYLISLIMFGVVFSFDGLGEAKEELTLAEIDKISSQIPALKDPLQRLLKNDSTLIELYLGSNKIGGQGAESLAKALRSNSSLTKLDLSANKIGDQETEHLANALHFNSFLKDLNLSCNQIGDQGADSLAKALHSNSYLTKLYLQNNKIGDQGAEATGKALTINSALTQLGLSYNLIGAQGAEAIGKALAFNSTLTLLYLSNNQIKSELIIQINELLTRNRKLAKNKPASKPVEHPKALSNNNNNNLLAQTHSTLVTSFIEAHKQSPESTKEFANQCLMSLYTANKVSEVYKNDSAYRLLTQLYQRALGTQDPKIIEFVKDTISEQCNTSPLFESLVDIYFANIKGTDQPYSVVSENLVKIHKQSIEAAKGFSKECLIPLYTSGKVPEAYKQDPIYQLLSQQYQKAVQNKDTAMIKSLEQIILEQCNKFPLFESLTEMYFFTLPNS